MALASNWWNTELLRVEVTGPRVISISQELVMSTVDLKLSVMRRVFKHLSTACLATVLAWSTQVAMAADAGWPQARNDAGGTSFNAGETSLSALNLANIQIHWATRVVYYANVVSADGQAFATIEDRDIDSNPLDRLVRLDPTNGATVWKVPSPYAGTASPAIVNDLVIVAGNNPDDSFDGLVTAFDRATGAVRWSYTVPAWFGTSTLHTPLVSGGRVYLLSYQGEILVLDAVTGGLIWNRRTESDYSYTGIALAVAGGKVFLTDSRKGLIARDAADGQEIWRFEPSPSKVIASQPMAVGDSVLFMDRTSRVYSLNALTGQVRWISRLPQADSGSFCFPSGDNSFSNLASDGSRVFALCLNSLTNTQKLSAFELVSGALLWKASVGEGNRNLAVANGVVYVKGKRLRAMVAATGAAIAMPKIRDEFYSSAQMILADGRLLFTTSAPGNTFLQAWGLPPAR
ncbi:MAG: hypothetical protein C4K60_03220 [Ideonella sp. MAG2]|nr:MAG: hypothetical protein C4K60_03220 [Ideonella sp. MAG2]